MSIANETRVGVSNHVMQRIRQRFSNRFRKYINDDQMLRNLIIGQVTSGAVLQDWKQAPFYKNKMDTKHGLGTEIILKSGVYFICKYQPHRDRLEVLTAVKSILYYPTENSIAIPTKRGVKWYAENEYITRLHVDALKENKHRNQT